MEQTQKTIATTPLCIEKFFIIAQFVRKQEHFVPKNAGFVPQGIPCCRGFPNRLQHHLTYICTPTRKMHYKIFIFLVSLTAIYGCNNCGSSMQELKTHPLSCVVDSVFNNPEDRHYPTVLLSCNGSYGKLYLTEFEFPHLYNYSAMGDKLVKDSASLEFRLIKKRYSHKLLSHL